MTKEELTAKFTEFCNKYQIHAADRFTENSVKFIESLKARYGNFMISDKISSPEDEIHIPEKIDAKGNEGFYYLDEFFFNKIVRNVRRYMETSNPRTKEKAKDIVENLAGVYCSNKVLVVNDVIMSPTNKKLMDEMAYFYKNGFYEKNENQNELQIKHGIYDVLFINNDDFKSLDENKSDDKIKALCEKFSKDQLYITFTHELFHAFHAKNLKYENETKYVMKLSDEYFTQQNFNTLPKIQKMMYEIIHDNIVTASVESKNTIKFIDPKNKNNVYKIKNVACSGCSYSFDADVAELLEMLVGKETLFYAVFENKEDFFKDINEKFKDVFYSTSPIIEFYKDKLCPIYNIKSKEFWHILSTLNYFITTNNITAGTIYIKIALQEFLINCLTGKIKEINPSKKSIKVLNEQLGFVKNLPAQVENVLLVKEECNKSKIKMRNVEAYKKLCEECTKKQKFIERNLEQIKLHNEIQAIAQ